jgi:hypothetical protein
LLNRARERGPSVYLRDHGITAIPFDRLNALLARHGLVIRAGKVRDVWRFVARTDKNSRVEQFGLFTRRTIPPKEVSECGGG